MVLLLNVQTWFPILLGKKLDGSKLRLLRLDAEFRVSEWELSTVLIP